MTLLLLSTADTDLLAARSVPEPALPLRLANPARTATPVDLLTACALVVVRLLGGRRAWEGLDALRADAAARARARWSRVGGEGALDAELADASTVPAGVVADAAGVPARGRAGQPARARGVPVRHRAAHRASASRRRRRCRRTACTASRAADPARPTVGVVFYRAHELSGNTAFVDVLCDAVEAAGANARPVYVGSLRPDGERPAAGGRRAARRTSTRWS